VVQAGPGEFEVGTFGYQYVIVGHGYSTLPAADTDFLRRACAALRGERGSERVPLMSGTGILSASGEPSLH
jgi:hypothetical protein